MGHVVHLPPIPQHPRTPGHKAFRSQLTANELGGIRFAGVGSKWSTVQPRSARANPLWQPRLWGSGVDIFPRRPHTYRGRRMPMGVTSNWCHPQGHHARRPPTTVPARHQHSAERSIKLSGSHRTQTQTNEVRWTARSSGHWVVASMFA